MPNIIINQYSRQKINRHSTPWMLKGGRAHLQVMGGRNHRSLHKEVVNLDVSRKERWAEGTFLAEGMP